MANEELKARVLKRAVENFLKTGRGTQRFQLVNEFRERNLAIVINELLRDGILRREMSGNLEEYAPSITGIYLSGNEDAIRTAKAAFILVGGILRDVFFEQPGNLGIDVPVLLERAQKIDQAASKNTVLLGFYALQDVGLTGGYRLGESGEILMVNTSEQLAVVPDFEAEWDDQIRNRSPRPDQQDQVADSTMQALEADPPAVALGKQLTTDALDLPLGKLTSWQKVGSSPLGSGGQGEVWLVRTPQRQREIRKSISDILNFKDQSGWPESFDGDEHIMLFANATNALSRQEQPSDLGALKQYKIPPGSEGDLAVARFLREIQVLRKGGPGLLKLLDFSESERWVVTEYLPRGSLAKQISLFKGRPYEALKAFRTLVQAVAELHKEKMVHRDIKPPNIFVRTDEELVLGDFGIVYLPEDGERVTMLDEKVGPRDYMPPWAPIDQRQETVKANFDVYMLGKLLWCMVSGRLKLPREYHKRPTYDVTVLFPDDPNMRKINEILERCVVEEPEQCLGSAGELLALVDESLAAIQKGIPILDYKGQMVLPCRVCGRGYYQEHRTIQFHVNDEMSRLTSPIIVHMFVCNVCTNYELFAPNFPDEAAKKGWKPWRSN